MKPKKTVKTKDGSIVSSDSRFQDVLSEPRFDELSHKRKTVVIDKRFKSMFTDTRFNERAAVDKRGRRLDILNEDNLKHLYDIEAQSSGSEEQEEVRIDLARGEGNVSSSDEDSDDEWTLEEVVNEELHKWGEFDRDASRVEWASRRLALCNMDWDRITAADLLVLLNSFKPTDSAVIESVSIYLSDFGKKRLEEEEKVGPRLPAVSIPNIDKNNETSEAIRAYQLERLRYYYGIIECDSVSTASAIYEGCDGLEFESSSIRLDLRFVPEDMDFSSNTVKESVKSEEVSVDKYKPKIFESAALSKSAAVLTWDENDPKRQKAVKDSFLLDADFEQLESLIAPGSSDEEEENTGRKKLSILLGESVDDNEKTGGQLHVSWGPGIVKDNKESTKAVSKYDTIENESVITRGSEKHNDDMTPWKKYLEKRKLKKKERKVRIAELKKQQKGLLINSSSSVLKGKQKSTVSGDANKNNDIIIDERFSALYTNSAFAIDQSNPLFKSSNIVNKQVDEKLKRKAIVSVDQELSTLTEKLKKKATEVTKRKFAIH